MECPNCHKRISDTAIRCQYCRKPVNWLRRNYAEDILKWSKKRFLQILFGGRDREACHWSIFDVFIITGLIALVIVKDPLRISAEIIKVLRLHFFILTKEPRLLYFLGNSISTIVFKGFALLFVMVLVKLRRVSFSDSVLSRGRVPDSWGKWLFLYIIVCVLFRFGGVSNPLIPNIPFHSVFIEATFIGNAVIICSILFVAPFVEEILFRGFLYPAVNRYVGVYLSIFLTSALCTMAHYPQIKDEVLFMVIIFMLNAMITYARAKTGSTWVAIIMHHVYNLTYVTVGFINFFIGKY